MAAPVSIELLERICFGDAGSVLHARYQGAPAVIKLFGPGSSEVFWREVQAYQRLQHHQGTLLPRLLASGYLVPGVLFIALSGEFYLPMCGAQCCTGQLHHVRGWLCCMQHQQQSAAACNLQHRSYPCCHTAKQPACPTCPSPCRCCACTRKLAVAVAGWLQATTATAATTCKQPQPQWQQLQQGHSADKQACASNTHAVAPVSHCGRADKVLAGASEVPLAAVLHVEALLQAVIPGRYVMAVTVAN